MRKMSQDQKTLRKEPRQQMVIYIKLCALTGLNWIPGLLSVFVDSEILWYAFLLFAGLQGLYVLLAFVCNARVLNMYKEKFCSKGSSPESLVEDHTKESNLSNSTSKDKQGKPAVDDKKNSSQTDEVIICESKLSTPAVHTENQKGGAEFTKL